MTGPNDGGVGAAIAERFAEEGAQLVLAGLDRPEKLIHRFERRQVSHLWHETDITNSKAVGEMVKAAVTAFGSFNVVVNNAGIGHLRPLEELSEDEWLHVYDVNVAGTARVIRTVLPHLQPNSCIVNVASAMGLTGCAGYSLYGSSKAAVVNMTISLAWELAPKRIRVVAVAPAMIPTPMMMPAVDHMDQAAWQQLEDCHPLGLGSPQDVAAAVAFLASDEARWITGVTLPMGWCSRQPIPTDVLFRE